MLMAIVGTYLFAGDIYLNYKDQLVHGAFQQYMDPGLPYVALHIILNVSGGA